MKSFGTIYNFAEKKMKYMWELSCALARVVTDIYNGALIDMFCEKLEKATKQLEDFADGKIVKEKVYNSRIVKKEIPTPPQGINDPVDNK